MFLLLPTYSSTVEIFQSLSYYIDPFLQMNSAGKQYIGILQSLNHREFEEELFLVFLFNNSWYLDVIQIEPPWLKIRNVELTTHLVSLNSIVALQYLFSSNKACDNTKKWK